MSTSLASRGASSIEFVNSYSIMDILAPAVRSPATAAATDEGSMASDCLDEGFPWTPAIHSVENGTSRGLIKREYVEHDEYLYLRLSYRFQPALRLIKLRDATLRMMILQRSRSLISWLRTQLEAAMIQVGLKLTKTEVFRLLREQISKAEVSAPPPSACIPGGQ